jgi:hypothetical protein
MNYDIRGDWKEYQWHKKTMDRYIFATDDRSITNEDIEEANRLQDDWYAKKEYEDALAEHHKELDEKEKLVDTDDDSTITKIKRTISDWF